MIYEGIEYFNAAEIEKTEDGAILLRRFPKSVIDSLNAPMFNQDGSILDVWYGGQETASQSSCIEIRLVTSAPQTVVEFESDADTDVMVFWGDFFHQKIHLCKDVKTKATIEKLECMQKLRPEIDKGRYNPDLLRIGFSYAGKIKVHSINVNGEYRLPTAEDSPKKMLVFGTSISHGQNSCLFGNEYVSVMARELGVDLINKAIAGGCFGEKEVKEFICAMDDDFDYAVFEIGTNIASRPDFFIEERLGAMMDAFCETFKDKKIFFVLPFLALEDLSDMYYGWKNDFDRVGKIMRAHLAKYPSVPIFSGVDLAPEASLFSSDVLHPSPYGNFIIGQRLAKLIKPFLS